ncbi:extracellular solute-binding protein [Carboxydochorda subterranea]|uniref:Extracellular solute-binding protein n=1 Tax=Carboxydichorda subterranea TaxID=3109565 RepID=A0ABZ1BYB1_9FIRM|nr:extracellular solute-binding protein [Limnochorda sp. L945t]WRP17799.1 extracellular solute-binding protein [Limnochorda sp. L945t]
MAVAVRAPSRPRESEAARAAALARRRTALGAWAAALVAVLALTAAFIYSRTRPATAPVPHLRVMTWASVDESAPLQHIVDEYNASHPSWQVQLDLTPIVAYDQKLVVLVAAGDAPDVFALGSDRLEVFARNGAVLDLTARWQRAPAGLKGAVPAGRLAPLRIDGKLMALPHPFSAGAMVISSRTRYPDQAWDFLSYLLQRMPPPAREPRAPEAAPGLGPIGPFGF